MKEAIYKAKYHDRDGDQICSITLNDILIGHTWAGQEKRWVEEHKKHQYTMVGTYKSAEDYEKNAGSITFQFKFKSKRKDYCDNVYFVATTDGKNFQNMDVDYFLNGESSCISKAFFADEPRRLMIQGENDTLIWNQRKFKIMPDGYGRVIAKEIKPLGKLKKVQSGIYHLEGHPNIEIQRHDNNGNTGVTKGASWFDIWFYKHDGASEFSQTFGSHTTLKDIKEALAKVEGGIDELISKHCPEDYKGSRTRYRHNRIGEE